MTAVEFHGRIPVGSPVTLVGSGAVRLTDPPRVGQVILIRSRGAWRPARVTKVGRVNVQTEYTTEGALRDAARWNQQPVITRKPFPWDEAYGLPTINREEQA